MFIDHAIGIAINRAPTSRPALLPLETLARILFHIKSKCKFAYTNL